MATGYNFDKDDLNNVEVVHLILNENETSVCDNLPPFPVFSRGKTEHFEKLLKYCSVVFTIEFMVNVMSRLL